MRIVPPKNIEDYCSYDSILERGQGFYGVVEVIEWPHMVYITDFCYIMPKTGKVQYAFFQKIEDLDVAVSMYLFFPIDFK